MKHDEFKGKERGFLRKLSQQKSRIERLSSQTRERVLFAKANNWEKGGCCWILVEPKTKKIFTGPVPLPAFPHYIPWPVPSGQNKAGLCRSW
jgi:hypothetical protein